MPNPSRLNRALTRARWCLRRADSAPRSAKPDPRTLVVILDGTMSSLAPGGETNAGLTYRLLQGMDGVQVYYEPGIQWQSWRSLRDVATGRGLNRQIRRAYRWLARAYRPGDRIFLFGYSRGAYAVRSLGGVIDRLGLLRAPRATRDNTRDIYGFYETGPASGEAQAFARQMCHRDVPIEMIGVWDTVKALGLRLPLLWRLTERRHAFHSTELGANVRRACHALALNERRAIYAPVLWSSQDARDAARIEQVWFPGTHGDIGGQLGGFAPARGLSNATLCWMLGRAEASGLALPEGWQTRFPSDPHAPSIGLWAGAGRMFLLRRARRVGLDGSERVHSSVALRRAARTPRLAVSMGKGLPTP
ncbi:DUF2235 domain-containing protein [Pseudaestuariivita sp.]|uniref:DUF2235 domain-containing protein n=1 Tax=Pseudaestuariivita sp. TaxID=2211669 RepID=UPI004059D20E